MYELCNFDICALHFFKYDSYNGASSTLSIFSKKNYLQQFPVTVHIRKTS